MNKNMATKSTTRTPVTQMNLDELRAEYRAIRSRAEVGNAEFDAGAAEIAKPRLVDGLNEEGTARVWVWAARRVTFTCRRCMGSGQFTTGTLNGRPTGPGGDCYRCGGKGVQNDADHRRNYGADGAAFTRACKAMFNGR